tara:strand:- start:2192 stop:2959 length:768 start_codon:yes stop_codon:yes gene_type:complete
MNDYKTLAKNARIAVLGLVHQAQISHIASNLSVIDIATVLYENVNLKLDRVVWSAGWKAATIYYFLNKKGMITDAQLAQFPSAPFYGLAETEVPGVEVNGGSMGHGLPVAVGMAFAKKRAGEEGKVYCIMSEGEQNEGSVWEAAMLAVHHKLDNLVAIIDVNKIQAMGYTKDIIDLEPLEDRWSGFGWEVCRIDGHAYDEIELNMKAVTQGRPRVLIADTVKGKGVSFMEGQLLYHYKSIDDETYEKALIELQND